MQGWFDARPDCVMLAETAVRAYMHMWKCQPLLGRLCSLTVNARAVVPAASACGPVCACLVLHRAGAAFCGEMRNVVFARVSQSVIRNMAREVRGVLAAAE